MTLLGLAFVDVCPISVGAKFNLIFVSRFQIIVFLQHTIRLPALQDLQLEMNLFEGTPDLPMSLRTWFVFCSRVSFLFINIKRVSFLIVDWRPTTIRIALTSSRRQHRCVTLSRCRYDSSPNRWKPNIDFFFRKVLSGAAWQPDVRTQDVARTNKSVVVATVFVFFL